MVRQDKCDIGTPISSLCPLWLAEFPDCVDVDGNEVIWSNYCEGDNPAGNGISLRESCCGKSSVGRVGARVAGECYADVLMF